MTIYVLAKPKRGAPYVQEFAGRLEIQKECQQLYNTDLIKSDKLVVTTHDFLSVMHGGAQHYVLIESFDDIVYATSNNATPKGKPVLMLLVKIAYLLGKEDAQP